MSSLPSSWRSNGLYGAVSRRVLLSHDLVEMVAERVGAPMVSYPVLDAVMVARGRAFTESESELKAATAAVMEYESDEGSESDTRSLV